MVKNIIIMGMEKDKLITQLDAILPTTVHFKKEYLAITKIRDFINTVADDKFKSCLSDLSYEIWKFYRVFKMKEFILLFKDRIKAESKIVDSTSNKTIEMLDEAFLWNITNWSNDSKLKYEQRFYSEMALEKFIIKDDSYDKLSNIKKNQLINLINEKYYKKYDKIKSHPNGDQKTKNNLVNTCIQTILDIKKPNLLQFIKTQYIEDFKSLIHAFACQAGSKIQLDHVYNRSAIKTYIEEHCINFNNKTCIYEQINNVVNLLAPLMFGAVVYNTENTELTKILKKKNKDPKSKTKIRKKDKHPIWTEYISAEIKLYDFDSKDSFGNILLIKDEDGFKNIKIKNPYDLISLPDINYKWNVSKQIWK